MAKAKTLFTIGYEQTPAKAVLDELQSAGVKLLVDVRAVAASRRPGFSKTQLAAGLDERGIGYVHLRGLGTPKEGREAADGENPLLGFAPGNQQRVTRGYSLDEARIRAVAPDADVDGLRAALEAVCTMCERPPTEVDATLSTQGKRFGWISAPRSTVLQPGPVHGGSVADPEGEVERLLDRLVR
jgi:hypothetical protein